MLAVVDERNALRKDTTSLGAFAELRVLEFIEPIELELATRDRCLGREGVPDQLLDAHRGRRRGGRQGRWGRWR